MNKRDGEQEKSFKDRFRSKNKREKDKNELIKKSVWFSAKDDFKKSFFKIQV